MNNKPNMRKKSAPNRAAPTTFRRNPFVDLPEGLLTDIADTFLHVEDAAALALTDTHLCGIFRGRAAAFAKNMARFDVMVELACVATIVTHRYGYLPTLEADAEFSEFARSSMEIRHPDEQAVRPNVARMMDIKSQIGYIAGPMAETCGVRCSLTGAWVDVDSLGFRQRLSCPLSDGSTLRVTVHHGLRQDTDLQAPTVECMTAGVARDRWVKVKAGTSGYYFGAAASAASDVPGFVASSRPVVSLAQVPGAERVSIEARDAIAWIEQLFRCRGLFL